MAKYCEKCGEMLDDDAVFCTSCGQRTAVNMVMPPQQPQPIMYYEPTSGADYATREEALSWFSYRGRLNRQRYILRSLMLTAVCIVLGLILFGGIAAIIGAAEMKGQSSSAGMGAIIIMVLVGILLELALVVMNYFLIIKRGHDVNLSGWVSVLVQIASGGFFSIILYFIKGNVGPNPYGDDPLTYQN